MLQEGLSLRVIARKLGRSPNSISLEIQLGLVKGVYDAKKADHKAYIRRHEAKYQGMKIAENRKLQEFVEAGLYDDLSPEAIAGRVVNREKDLPSVSKNSIRRYIKSVPGRRVEYHRIKQRRKRKRGRKRTKVTQLTDRTFVDKRPKSIQNRRYVGDVEADFLVSGKTGRGIILSVVCRKLRISFLEQILEVTIENMHQAFLKIQERFPELRSITTDNDLLFQKHKTLEKLLEVKIYFCHPYHSWEKGSVENINRYVRKDIPKGTDISRYSKRFIKKLEAKLNRRYMAVLNYKTPQEVLHEYRKRKKH